jgi:hypothetical protein
MKIIRNKSIEEWSLNEVQINWGTGVREGVHLSDLLAPRKKYWQTLLPKKPTIKEISYWTSGGAIEDKFLKAIGYQHGEARIWNGIWYTPDTFFNFPAEIKSRRRGLAKEGEEETYYEHYLKQLKGYCAVEGKTKGWLIVLSLLEKQDNNKTAPEWAYYDVDFEEEELDKERDRLTEVKILLEHSLKTKNHTILEPCPKWMCGKELKIMEQKPVCQTCGKSFETEWGMERHLNSKTGMGHDMCKPIYRIEYEKDCKYFDECDPFGTKEAT